MTRLAVIIPSLNEAAVITEAIRSAWTAGADEILVSDAGSSDQTLVIARREGAIPVESERIRGRQLNHAAKQTRADVLLFLHADTMLPATARASVDAALDKGYTFGGFRISFAEPHARLRLAETMINFRTSMTRCPWGDQAQFVRASDFHEAGGFREIPIMEDYEFARRMKSRGKSIVLKDRVRTSGRRFLEKGVLRTAAINWRIILAYHLGVSPERLREIYRG